MLFVPCIGIIVVISEEVGTGLLKCVNIIWEKSQIQVQFSCLFHILAMSVLNITPSHTISFKTVVFMAWLHSAHFMNQKTNRSS